MSKRRPDHFLPTKGPDGLGRRAELRFQGVVNSQRASLAVAASLGSASPPSPSASLPLSAMRYLTAAAALATLASLVVALPATVCASRQYLDAACASRRPSSRFPTLELTARARSRRLQDLPLEHADLHERDDRPHLVRFSPDSRTRESLLIHAVGRQPARVVPDGRQALRDGQPLPDQHVRRLVECDLSRPAAPMRRCSQMFARRASVHKMLRQGCRDLQGRDRVRDPLLVSTSSSACSPGRP